MTTEIICRFDANKNKPVVFIPHMMEKDKGTILSWTSGDPDLVPLSYYHSTVALSRADEEFLLKRYARHFKDNDVVLRHRLPRTNRVLPNLLAKTPAEPAPAPQAAPLLPEPAIAAAPAAQPAPAPAAKPRGRKTAAKKAAAKKGGRRPAAKPIDAQPAPAPTMNAPMAEPSLEDKVNQLTNIVAQLTAAVQASFQPARV